MTAPIDLQHLDKYVLGDAALLDEILTIFIDQTSAWVDRIDPTQSDQDWRLATHTLKGASRGVGAWMLGDIAERAEELVGPGQDALREAIRGELRTAADAAINYARKIREPSAGT